MQEGASSPGTVREAGMEKEGGKRKRSREEKEEERRKKKKKRKKEKKRAKKQAKKLRKEAEEQDSVESWWTDGSEAAWRDRLFGEMEKEPFGGGWDEEEDEDWIESIRRRMESKRDAEDREERKRRKMASERDAQDREERRNMASERDAQDRRRNMASEREARDRDERRNERDSRRATPPSSPPRAPRGAAEPTHYDRLGLGSDATDAQIRAAYLKLARQFHPDKDHTSDRTDFMAKLNHARDILSDPDSRRRYDLSLPS